MSACGILVLYLPTLHINTVLSTSQFQQRVPINFRVSVYDITKLATDDDDIDIIELCKLLLKRSSIQYKLVVVVSLETVYCMRVASFYPLYLAWFDSNYYGTAYHKARVLNVEQASDWLVQNRVDNRKSAVTRLRVESTFSKSVPQALNSKKSGAWKTIRLDPVLGQWPSIMPPPDIAILQQQPSFFLQKNIKKCSQDLTKLFYGSFIIF